MSYAIRYGRGENSDTSTHAAGHAADRARAMVAAIRDGTFIWTETELERLLRQSIEVIKEGRK